jgi:hypothetical protein
MQASAKNFFVVGTWLSMKMVEKSGLLSNDAVHKWFNESYTDVHILVELIDPCTRLFFFT